jgi:hypothetical protein
MAQDADACLPYDSGAILGVASAATCQPRIRTDFQALLTTTLFLPFNLARTD